MNRLIAKIANKVTADYCRLSIVENPDGFLTQSTVRHLLYQEHGLEVITGSNLQLRIHFELHYKEATGKHFIYVCQDKSSLLPDMMQGTVVCDFNVSDVFPLFADKSLVNRQSFDVLNRLDEKNIIKRVSMSECHILIDGILREIEEEKRRSAEYFNQQLAQIPIDWSHPKETMAQVSAVTAQAIKAGASDGIGGHIADINNKFQDWVDGNYFATLHSNALLQPKSVNAILPHLEANYGIDDKLALLVVDGFSYWQYTLLKDYMHGKGIQTQDNTTLAWLPSITMLSRQAIFRGGTPKQDYKQSPENERQLWTDYWREHGFGNYEIQYLSDKDEFAVNEGIKRLAVVTTEMDEKMHSSTDYKDLCSLTENWCPRITEQIEAILSARYTLYLTTDHGSAYSQGWRALTQVEKVFLYKDGSRGARHLIYNNEEEQKRFVENNPALRLLVHDNWMSIRGEQCFARENTNMITHGGSHFMEVVIPWVKITR